ncbi:hypothetical protein PYW08_006137 [Mythimna loreyi]|uniref:Uncharacterized protein n=1 Tax=Mythimna loreyi TaxID=667449 RepID=A0ACC2QLU6_9NEOP|nr:hypothetical protein PYW08_006137 [Mythimna loreyi]
MPSSSIGIISCREPDDSPGGTGKTILITLLLAKIRSQNEVALALASSGIAVTLLKGGRTAHSALKLPLNMHINETPVCNVAKNSVTAKTPSMQIDNLGRMHNGPQEVAGGTR